MITAYDLKHTYNYPQIMNGIADEHTRICFKTSESDKMQFVKLQRLSIKLSETNELKQYLINKLPPR